MTMDEFQTLERMWEKESANSNGYPESEGIRC